MSKTVKPFSTTGISIKSLIIIAVIGIGKPNANGMSLFFPQTKILSLNENSNALQTLGKGDTSISHNTEPNDLVDFYMDSLNLDTSIPIFDVKQNNNVISGNYYDDDVYEINFYFTSPTDEGWIEIFHSDEYDVDESGFEYGEINFPWDGHEPALCNTQYCYPISPDWEWGERDFAYLPVILYFDVNDPDGLIGSIIYDITDEDNGIFIGFLPSGDRPGDVSKQILDLNEGNIVQIRAVEVTEDFKQTKFTKVEELLVDKDFGFSWEIFDWGPLNVFVEVCDFSGNCAELQGPFTMDPRDVPDIDMSESYDFEQNDPLNPIDEDYETYDDLGNYDSEYFNNLEFISTDTFCIELHSEFDDDSFDDVLGWEEVQNVCLTASTTYSDSIPIEIADEYWDKLEGDTVTTTQPANTISHDEFCPMLQDEFDDELGESAVDDLCVQYYSQYGDYINDQTTYDIIDQIWDEIES